MLPRHCEDKIEQVVRLIRSKGVGIYFISQSPIDIPDIVLGQLGNRVQHALRAFTPRDQKAVKTAAETFRPIRRLIVEAAITELEVGEALVSMLDDKGAPGIVDRAFVLPPRSKIGPIEPAQRLKIINWSPVQGTYDNPVDRESAYELLKQRADQKAVADAAAEKAEQEQKEAERQAKRRRRNRRDLLARDQPRMTPATCSRRWRSRRRGNSAVPPGGV